MKITEDEITKEVKIDIPYELVYRLDYLNKKYHHKEIADVLAAEIAKGRKLKTHMVIIEDASLADEHWDDPQYMHKTNQLLVCEAMGEARSELTNKYYRGAELTKFMEKHNLLTWRYNYQPEEDDERQFKFEIEDAVFEYQIMAQMVKNIMATLENAKYKLDEYGYPVEHEDDPDDLEEIYSLETDPVVIEKQKEILLERLLSPRMHTRHERVYSMPEPFSHWDERSFWHQFFFVEDEDEKTILCHRGNGGSSGAREDNGRWAHTFAYLSKVHGIETPTYHLQYDSHNKLNLIKKYDEFKSFQYDLSGNYPLENFREDRSLFDDRIIPCIRQFGRG